MKFQAIYVPIGVGTYEMMTAHEQFNNSIELLKSIDEDIVVPDDILLTVDAVAEFIKDKNPNLVILQNILLPMQHMQVKYLDTLIVQFFFGLFVSL